MKKWSPADVCKLLNRVAFNKIVSANIILQLGDSKWKDFENIWFKTFSSSYVFTVAKIDVWSFDIFENLCTWLSTYKMYIFGTIPLLRIYKVYKSNSSFFITDCGGYKQF